MKTTIELRDDLLAEAKAVAAKRRTTLKAMIEHSLEREILKENQAANPNQCFTIDDHGLPVFKRQGDKVITSQMIYDMMEELGI